MRVVRPVATGAAPSLAVDKVDDPHRVREDIESQGLFVARLRLKKKHGYILGPRGRSDQSSLGIAFKNLKVRKSSSSCGSL